MRVIGTAGHVDHGKSALVEALTGINPDRLKEEQDRQMTIDLGFAWMKLPGGEGLGIVDVPGHRDFIENMLAGVGAINGALLVVAADEGIMPQTREHLAILDLLDIPGMVVALTKTDLVADPDWIALVREELRDLLAETQYARAPIVEVSATVPAGLTELTTAIDRALADASEPSDHGRPRLPIDRAFTISGFGTVVTGTLKDGPLEIDQEVEVQPTGLRGRIRGLQTHRESIERAVPASRVAINLGGIKVEQVARGDVVSSPGADRGTTMLDARVRVLLDAPVPIRQDMQLKLFSGSALRMVKTRLLGTEQLKPGETGWLQLLLREPIVVRRGDRLILRRPSPSATLGGGQVADPYPARRYRPGDQDRLATLQTLLEGSDREVLVQAVRSDRTLSLQAASEFAGLRPNAAATIVRQAAAEGKLVVLNPERPSSDWMLMSGETMGEVAGRARAELRQYHDRFPARIGMPREELRSRIGDAPNGALDVLIREGELRERGAHVSLENFEPQLSQSEQAQVDRLLRRFESDPRRPPSVKDCLEAVDQELFNYLLESGKLVRVSEAVVFEAGEYHRLVEQLTQLLEQEGSVTVAEIRTRFKTTRKYALALLEHLDLVGLTYREGDLRRLVRPGS